MWKPFLPTNVSCSYLQPCQSRKVLEYPFRQGGEAVAKQPPLGGEATKGAETTRHLNES